MDHVVRARLRQPRPQLPPRLPAPRATVLLQTLFPTGLDFLKLPYAEEWAESERRLAMIKRDGLASELEALAGKPYLPAVKKAHTAYGAALGITDKKAATVDAVRVVEPLRASAFVLSDCASSRPVACRGRSRRSSRPRRPVASGTRP